MAVTFTLSDGTTTIDFAEATPDDFTLRANIGLGYLPKVAVPRGDGSIPDYITETIPVWIECTNHNDFATSMQNFHALQRRAVEYWVDPQQATPVWFNAKLDDETGARRALVKSLGLEFETEFGGLYNDCPDLDTGRPATVVVVRHPYWERSAALSAATGSNVSILGGAFDYSGTDVVGDVGARIDNLGISADDTTWLKNVYIGFRSTNRHPTITNFVSKWECEDGSNQTDATDVVDATASGGNAVDISFATAGWALRIRMELDDSTANESSNYGQFLMLMRCSTDGGSEAEFYVSQGSTYTGEWTDGPVAYISGGWALVPCGVLTIPYRNLKGVTTALLSDAADSKLQIEIYARRIAGAGTMHFDCLCLCPIDEYMLFIDKTYLLSSQDREVLMAVTPHDVPCGVSFENATANDPIRGTCHISVIGGGVPIGDGRAYMFASGVFDDTVDLSTQLVPRWITLRGAE